MPWLSATRRMKAVMLASAFCRSSGTHKGLAMGPPDIPSLSRRERSHTVKIIF